MYFSNHMIDINYRPHIVQAVVGESYDVQTCRSIARTHVARVCRGLWVFGGFKGIGCCEEGIRVGMLFGCCLAFWFELKFDCRTQ